MHGQSAIEYLLAIGGVMIVASIVITGAGQVAPTQIETADISMANAHCVQFGETVCEQKSGIAGTHSFDCVFRDNICVASMVVSESCGNGIKEAGEECDGSDVGGENCITQGKDGGTLSCTSLCTLNTSNCCSHSCGSYSCGQRTCVGTYYEQIFEVVQPGTGIKAKTSSAVNPNYLIAGLLPLDETGFEVDPEPEYQIRVGKTGYRICNNYDSDPCCEWSQIHWCTNSCSNGYCS